jgi:hypothetical protein
VLLRPQAGFRTFGNVLGVGNKCYYLIRDEADPSIWEVGEGEYVGHGILKRENVLVSSAAGDPVCFASSRQDVFLLNRRAILALGGQIKQH